MFRWRPSLPVPFQDQLKADDHIAWLTVTPGSNHLLNDSQEKMLALKVFLYHEEK